MTANSKIEWTDHTFNPWVGCEKISPGCDHCYAESWAKRTGNPQLWQGTRRITSQANWRAPLKWNKAAELTGIRQRVFCASLADVFDNEVHEAWRHQLFGLIRQTPWLDWLLLTKRIGNARAMTNSATAVALGTWNAADEFVHAPADAWDRDYWPNVWLGATVVNQAEADRDIPKLLTTPARVRFLSMEPLLGPVNLDRIEIGDHRHPLGTWCAPLSGCFTDSPRIDWVIVGGESGPRARQIEVPWVTHLQRQCHEAGVPLFIKQLGRFPITANGMAITLRDGKGGNMAEWPESLRVRQFPT